MSFFFSLACSSCIVRVVLVVVKINEKNLSKFSKFILPCPATFLLTYELEDALLSLSLSLSLSRVCACFFLYLSRSRCSCFQRHEHHCTRTTHTHTERERERERERKVMNEGVIEISSSSSEEGKEEEECGGVEEERGEHHGSRKNAREMISSSDDDISLSPVRFGVQVSEAEEKDDYEENAETREDKETTDDDDEEEVILIDSDDDDDDDDDGEPKDQQQQQRRRNEEETNSLKIGMEVIIHDIQNRPELNGTKGEIVKYLGGLDRRYSVKVGGSDGSGVANDVFALKEMNLIDFNKDGWKAMEVMLQVRAEEKEKQERDRKRKEIDDDRVVPTNRNAIFNGYVNDDDESPMYTRMASPPPPSTSPPGRRMVPPPSPSTQFTPTRSKYARSLPYTHPVYQFGKSKMFGKITCVLDHDIAISNVGKAILQGLDAPNGISGVSKDYKTRLRCTSRTLLPIPASITWIRHPEKELMSIEECRRMLQDLTQMQVDEDPRLHWSLRTTLILNGEAFVKLLEKEEETERLRRIQDGSLSDILLKAKRRSDSVGILTLMVYGLDDYVLKRTRKEMAQVGAKDAFNDKFVSALKTKLVVRSGGFGNLGKIQVKIVDCLNEQAVVDNIIGTHRWLAELPFKKNHNAISVGIAATVDEKKIKKMDHLNVSWIKSLAVISGLAEEHAHVVATRFPSAKKLIEHFERYKDDRNGGEQVIADLDKFSNRHRDGRQKIGIAVAHRLRIIFSRNARAGDIM